MLRTISAWSRADILPTIAGDPGRSGVNAGDVFQQLGRSSSCRPGSPDEFNPDKVLSGFVLVAIDRPGLAIIAGHVRPTPGAGDAPPT